MAVDVEQLLLLKAKADAEARNSPLGMGLGAAAGLGTGVVIGSTVHDLGNMINKGLDRISPYHPKVKGTGGAPAQRLDAVPRGKTLGARMRPGNRMAGGLVGLVIGGGLGDYAQKAMVGESEAAALLSKLQVHGQLTETEQQSLQQVLQNTYNSMLG